MGGEPIWSTNFEHGKLTLFQAEDFPVYDADGNQKKQSHFLGTAYGVRKDSGILVAGQVINSDITDKIIGTTQRFLESDLSVETDSLVHLGFLSIPLAGFLSTMGALNSGAFSLSTILITLGSVALMFPYALSKTFRQGLSKLSTEIVDRFSGDYSNDVQQGSFYHYGQDGIDYVRRCLFNVTFAEAQSFLADQIEALNIGMMPSEMLSLVGVPISDSFMGEEFLDALPIVDSRSRELRQDDYLLEQRSLMREAHDLLTSVCENGFPRKTLEALSRVVPIEERERFGNFVTSLHAAYGRAQIYK